MEHEEREVWLIQRYHGHVIYTGHRLEQSLVWDVETLVKMLFRLEAMSVNEIYVNMTYEMGFPPILDVYVCESCLSEPRPTETKISTDIYSCVVALSCFVIVYGKVCEEFGIVAGDNRIFSIF